jgi:hypothetical protein
VFGVPLFSKDAVDDFPDVLSAPADKSSGAGSNQSGGFLDKLNPFNR